MAPYCFVTIVLSTFLQLSNVTSNQASRSPSYFSSTGGNSTGILNLNSAFEKADRLLEHSHTISQYDKNEQLTFY
jgi:hypothetical protein